MPTSYRHYEYNFIMNMPPGDEDQGVVRIMRYRFKSENGFYIVDIHEYRRIERVQVFAIKFFPKSQLSNKNKYKVVLNKSWQIESRKVIFTVFKICIDLLEKKPHASFVFYGEKKPDEDNENTQRFRIYSKFISFFVTPDLFHNYWDEKTSTYLLLNSVTKPTDEVLCLIKRQFSDYLTSAQLEDDFVH